MQNNNDNITNHHQQHQQQQNHQKQQQNRDVIFIDSRSHLEVADKKHRYSKHLRFYFKEYDNITKCKSVNNYNTSSSNVNSNKEGQMMTNNYSSNFVSTGHHNYIGGYNKNNNRIDDYNNCNNSNNKWIRYEPFFEWLDNSSDLPNVSYYSICLRCCMIIC
jgi:hypothetical protein